MNIELRLTADTPEELVRGIENLSKTMPPLYRPTDEKVEIIPVRETVGEEAPVTEEAPAETETDEAPKFRMRGKPSEGKSKRTKAEMEEDKLLEELAGEAKVTLTKLDEVLLDQQNRQTVIESLNTRIAANDEETAANISTGGERVDPDDDETQAQDAADEAAESAQTEKQPLEQLRHLMGEYSKKFGIPEAVKLVKEGGLIGKGVDQLNEAEVVEAISNITLALEMGSDTSAAPSSEPKTKQDVIKAMLDYAKKFDGEGLEQHEMTNLNEDGPKIFTKLFGAGIEKLSHIPEDRYGDAVTAFEDAIEKNPFERGVVS